MIASVVLAVAVIGISGVLSASYQHSTIQGQASVALDLARQLMEEISAKPFEVSGVNKLGWSAGVTDRTQYDTIDDYDGYTDSSTAIRTHDNRIISVTGDEQYLRRVSVEAGAIPAGLSGPASDFALVTVTVQTPRQQEVRISQLFTRVRLER